MGAVEELKSILAEMREWKHMAGSHDQSAHGNWSEGRMVERVLTKHGFTYQPFFKSKPTKGFALSIYPQHEVVENCAGVTKTILKERVAAYVKAKAEMLKDPRNHVGAWWNVEGDGKLYFDMSIVVPTKEEAIALGKEHGQLGAFDLEKMEDVQVMTPEERAEWEKAHQGG